MANQTMRAGDAISGSLGQCFVTIGTKRYNFMSLVNIEAKIDLTKSEVSILGRTGKGNKVTGWKGTGSGTIHYNTSIFREMLKAFKDTAVLPYFDIQITNEDEGSTIGRQTTILKQCMLDGGVIAKLAADSETLDESIDFTFEDYEMPETFTQMPGM